MRPKQPTARGRESENENLRPAPTAGSPPRPATEPPGSEWSTKSDSTRTDPGSGEAQMSQKGRNARKS